MLRKSLFLMLTFGFTLTLLVVGSSFSEKVYAKNYKGCYTCRGGSYVKYRGSDTWQNRKKAKALGCDVTGTTSSCDAGNNKVLGTVG
ncbi:MAG: hypothetical protein OEZ36_03245 [Spirochaetota bacterium]|nr:hypothetical protein [Spirochaetota bacterium]